MQVSNKNLCFQPENKFFAVKKPLILSFSLSVEGRPCQAFMIERVESLRSVLS